MTPADPPGAHFARQTRAPLIRATHGRTSWLAPGLNTSGPEPLGMLSGWNDEEKRRAAT